MNTDALHPAARRARLDALDALNWPARIDIALRQLAHAESPLRASQGGGSGGGISDPTGSRALDNHDNPTDIRRQLLDALHAREDAARTINNILSREAPIVTAEAAKQLEAINDAMWCANHLAHRTFVPRRNGRYCGWCADVRRNYGSFPTQALIRMHDQGRRISEAMYREAFTKKTKKGKAA